MFVVVGPFNEHMLTHENRQAYFKIRNGMVAWLEQEHIPQASPEALPSQLYADASHPLTAGYQLLARRILSDAGFRQWMDSIRK